MSVSISGTCPHGRGVFIWVADGPYLGDPADPDYGKYAWVHNTTAPGDRGCLRVCELMPFATAGESGEVCACGHPAREHDAAPGPLPHGRIAKPRPCPCGCPDFENRPEDLARWREEGKLSANPVRFGETEPRPGDQDEQGVRLSAGESVPGGPGACARAGCAHLTLWHGPNGRFKGQPCLKCECPAFTGEPGEVMPLVQGSLFDGAFA